MSSNEKIIYRGKIAGISFHHYRFRPDRLKNRVLVVSPEPTNEHDDKAIALLVLNGSMAHKVGFIPRDHTHKLHKVLAEKGRLHAVVDGMDYSTHQVGIPRVTVTLIDTTERTEAIRKKKARAALSIMRPVGTRRILL